MVPHGRLALAVPSRPCREPVPGPGRYDPVPTDPRRQHGRRERSALRTIPGRAVARPSRFPGGRTPDPRDGLLPRQGADDPGLRPGPPGAVRGRGAAVVRRADVAARGRPEDGQLRPRLRVRDPRDPGGHARAPHREPSRSRPDAHPGGDRGAPTRERRSPVLDPSQPALGAARTEPLSSDRPEVRTMSDPRALCYRPRDPVGESAAAPGGPASRAGVGGSRARAASETRTIPARISHANG